jgi:hypothetical protein
MRIFYAAWLPIVGFVLLAGAFPFARGKNRWHTGCMTALVLLSLTLVTSCGGGGSSSATTTTGTGSGGTRTTAGNYTVTVAASGGTASPQQTLLTLTVQ